MTGHVLSCSAEFVAILFEEVKLSSLVRALGKYGTVRGIVERMITVLSTVNFYDPAQRFCYTKAGLAKWRQTSGQSIKQQHWTGRLTGLKVYGKLFYPAVQLDRAGALCSMVRDLLADAKAGLSALKGLFDWLQSPVEGHGVTSVGAREAARDTHFAVRQTIPYFSQVRIIKVPGDRNPGERSEKEAR